MKKFVQCELTFPLSQIHTAARAAEMWGIEYSTFKNQLKGKGKKETVEKIEKCKERGMIAKDGRVFLIAEQAMYEIYGSPKGKNQCIEDVKSKKLNSPHDENTKNIPRDNTLKEQLPSKVQVHIQVLSSISPYKLIEHYQNGGKVAPADQKIIEELLNKYQLIPEVVNVLLEFIMLTYNRKLPKEVIYKIAGHWKRLKIQSVEEAIQQAKKNFKEQKNNFKTKNNLRKNKRVEKIPSAIIEQIEQQKNTNNEKSKENKEHSQLSYEERLKIYNEKLVLLNKKKTDSMSL
ncbi:DnaD domain protein [Aneurinibacillus aneurinilyticus]|uniref:DnaD domain protein n=1 Tax=Aneurinibacillus aneurinilyticus TaxID=1391 RepID=UPI0035268680